MSYGVYFTSLKSGPCPVVAVLSHFGPYSNSTCVMQCGQNMLCASIFPPKLLKIDASWLVRVRYAGSFVSLKSHLFTAFNFVMLYCNVMYWHKPQWNLIVRQTPFISDIKDDDNYSSLSSLVFQMFFHGVQMIVWHIEVKTKWQTFCTQHFQMQFLVW